MEMQNIEFAAFSLHAHFQIYQSYQTMPDRALACLVGKLGQPLLLNFLVLCGWKNRLAKFEIAAFGVGWEGIENSGYTARQN